MARYDSSRFFCMACGGEGIPLSRKRGQAREKFHRKKLYCPHCRNTVNHIECKTLDEIEVFKEEFKQGVYENEAKESMVASRNTWLW